MGNNLDNDNLGSVSISIVYLDFALTRDPWVQNFSVLLPSTNICTAFPLATSSQRHKGILTIKTTVNSHCMGED